LPARHPVDTVVENDGGDINIPPGGVNEMIPADGHGVPVPHDHDDLQLGLASFTPVRESEARPWVVCNVLKST